MMGASAKTARARVYNAEEVIRDDTKSVRAGPLGRVGYLAWGKAEGHRTKGAREEARGD